MALMEVTTIIEDIVCARLYPPKLKSMKWKFKVGDKVGYASACSDVRSKRIM